VVTGTEAKKQGGVPSMTIVKVIAVQIVGLLVAGGAASCAAQSSLCQHT
jgi:hypothetical protein